MSENAYVRLPPQNLDSERALLGSLILSPHLFDEIVIESDDLYLDKHQVVHAAMKSLWSRGIQGIDVVTIAQELLTTSLLERAGGPAYLAELRDAGSDCDGRD